MTAPDEEGVGRTEGRRMASVAIGMFDPSWLGRDADDAEFRRLQIACAQRTERQIRAIVRDEIQRAFVPPMVLLTDAATEVCFPQTGGDQ